MMDPRKIALLATALLLLFVFAAPLAGEPFDSIIVNDADAIIQVPASSNQGLSDHIGQVGLHVVVEYANDLRRIGLPTLPGEFQLKIGQVPARVVIKYANTNRSNDLANVPTALQTLLAEVPTRVVIQYAKANRSYRFSYPVALMNDTTPPQISEIAARTTSNDTASITWKTDEFATSEILYGTQSGTYPWSANDPLYTEQHQVNLTGLTTGTTYYYMVRSTDRSGNISISSENRLGLKSFVYLPLVRRNP